MIIFLNTSAARKQHTKAEFTTYKADPKVSMLTPLVLVQHVHLTCSQTETM